VTGICLHFVIVARRRSRPEQHNSPEINDISRDSGGIEVAVTSEWLLRPRPQAALTWRTDIMFVTIIGKRVFVRLSRRNLQQLDDILAQPAARNRGLARKDENGVCLVVHVEDDAEHYEGRHRGPRLGWAA
jgi:hypothetical protein